MKRIFNLNLAVAIAVAGLIAPVAQATVSEYPNPLPQTTSANADAAAAANAAANAKAAADLKAQQDLKAAQDLKAQQDLKAAQDLKANQNLTGTVNGTAATTSGPASTVGGNAGGGSANTTGGNAQSTSGPASSNSGPASSVSGPANTTGGNAATTGGSANTASGPANTTGGAVKTDVGVGVGINAGVKQNVDGSAGGNTLKTGDSAANLDLKNVGNSAGGNGYGGTGGNTGAITVTPKVDVGTNASSTANGGIGGGAKVDTKVTGANTQNGTIAGTNSGTNQLDSKVSGSNAGTFQNDGKQTTSIGLGLDSKSSSDNKNTVSTGSSAGASNSGSSDSTSSATGNGAGNTTNVNTSTTNVQPVQVPVLFNPLPPLVTAAGSLITERLACGPLQQVVKTKVYGTQVGIFKNTSIDLGSDYELAPVFEADGKQRYYNEREFMESGEKVVRRFGNQAIVVTALPNVSGASTLSIGFAGTNGGGNGGGGSSSAMSRIVTKITMSDCELPGAYKMVRVATVAPKPVVAATPAPQLTREDILGALSVLNNLKLDVTVPTDRVESVRVGCKVEEFTDAAGRKVSMCRGSASGSYGVTKVVKDSVTVRGELHSGASAKK